MLEKATEQLKSDVLECQAWAPKKLQQPLPSIGIELAQRGNLGMVEIGVRGGDQLSKLIAFVILFDVRPHHIRGHLGVAGFLSATGNRREFFWDVEAPIRGHALHENF